MVKGGDDMLKITEPAARELRELIERKGANDTVVRLYLAGMG